MDPAYWFPPLFAHAFGRDLEKLSHMVNMHLRPAVAPPPELFLFQGVEGESEIDILMQTERATWFIEAKYRHDVKEKTTNKPERDQVLRNIDVGSWYAGVRDFYFTLLVLDDEHSPCRNAAAVAGTGQCCGRVGEVPVSRRYAHGTCGVVEGLAQWERESGDGVRGDPILR